MTKAETGGPRTRADRQQGSGDGVRFAQLCALRGAVRLEGLGMRHSSGKSMMALAKRRYNLKGNRAKILAQMGAMIDAQIAETCNRREDDGIR